MNLKKLFLVPIIICLCACSSGSKTFAKCSFRHQQGVSDYSDYMYYDDSIFNHDSTEFDPKLASASIAFSMASFASMDEEHYSNKSKNARALLNKMGFSNFETNQWFKEKPGADTIGVLAAKKKIGDYTVVAVGLRGAAYFSEWASNFTLGNREDGFHQGFRDAADHCIEFMKEYISSKNITGDIKIWIVGYSRAGATSNIASGLLDDALNNDEKPFGNSVNLTRNHLYSYCFEAPQGAPNKLNENSHVAVKTANYNNIFNILNINDPVPLVAMKELGFTRYGIDMYLPDPLTTLNYEGHFENMNNLYDHMSNHEAIGSYQIDKFDCKGLSEAHSVSQGLFLREFIADLTLQGISHQGSIPLEECLAFYNDYVQTGLRNLFKTLYQSEAFKGSLADLGIAMVTDLGIIEELDILISDLTVEGVQAFINDFRPILTRGLNSLKLEVDVKETVDNLIEFIKIIGHEMYAGLLNGKSYELLSWFNKDNLKCIASGHYPELCAAHVRALDDNYVNNPYTDYANMDGQYYHLSVGDKETSIVIKNNDKIIVNIHNDGEIDNSISYYRNNDGYHIYLPYHEHYSVQFGTNCEFDLSYFDREYQDYIDIPKSLDLNNSFSI